jgi:hypothetical protein
MRGIFLIYGFGGTARVRFKVYVFGFIIEIRGGSMRFTVDY